MRNFEDELGVANNHSPPMEEKDVFANPTENEEIHDVEVTMLFEDARDKLVRVEANAIKQKRQIVVDLAKSLEGKIATDSICMEIIDKLRGQVSASFIRQCLDEKYKQKTSVENARKQQQKHKLKLDEKLATVTSLNQEDAETKKKVIMVEGGGNQTLIQDDVRNGEDDQLSIYKESGPIKGKDYVAESSISQEQEQKQPPKTPNESIESETNPSPDDSHFDSIESEDDIEDSSKMDAAGDTTTYIALTNYTGISDKPENDNGHIIPFEINFKFVEIRRHMAPLYQKIGDNGKVWFSGRIDKKTGKVVSSSLGRL